MADIGVLPSRTSVQITSSNGENGTIPAATSRAAGVMTGAQAEQLEMLWQASQTGDLVPTLIVPERMPRADAVSRDELRAALQAVQRSVALPVGDDSVNARLAAIEARQDDLDLRLIEFARAFEGMCNLIDGLSQDQKFIEKHAVARVGVAQ